MESDSDSPPPSFSVSQPPPRPAPPHPPTSFEPDNWRKGLIVQPGCQCDWPDGAMEAMAADHMPLGGAYSPELSDNDVNSLNAYCYSVKTINAWLLTQEQFDELYDWALANPYSHDRVELPKDDRRGRISPWSSDDRKYLKVPVKLDLGGTAPSRNTGGASTPVQTTSI